jgi:DNA adenine methylase
VEYINAPYKRYNGGKSGNGTYQGIINHIPPIDTLVSLFTGNGGVERRINMRGGKVVINDVNADLIKRYNEIVAKMHGAEGRRITVWDFDGIELLEMLTSKDTPFSLQFTRQKTLIYADPPYLKDTRQSQQDLYVKEWGYDDHVRFLNLVKKAKNSWFKISINHPPHLLYENMLQGWNVYDYQSMTSSGKKMRDRLWYNYPPPTELQDYQYLGKDYRQREIISRRIKRQVSNIFKKYGKDDRLNQLQRNAVIQAIIDKKNSV